MYDTYNGAFKKVASHLGRVAAEAIAIKYPILEGPWEHVAWLIVEENIGYSKAKRDIMSDNFIAWIMDMMSDSELCPNVHLKVGLMDLLQITVDLNGQYGKPALESVISAFSDLNLDLTSMELFTIVGTLIRFDKALYAEFDEKLSGKLTKVRTTRMSATIHDVSYHHAINPKRYSQPKVVYGLTYLITTLSRLGCQTLQIQNDNEFINENESHVDQTIVFTSQLLQLVPNLFPKTCNTSPMIEVIKSFSLVVKELKIAVDNFDNSISSTSLSSLDSSHNEYDDLQN